MPDINVKNKKLYDALLSLTKASLEIITRRTTADLPVTTESVWVKQDGGSYIKQPTPRPFWVIVLHKANTEIKETPEFLDFLSVVTTDEVISRQLNQLVGTCLGSFRFEADRIASWPVCEFLTDQKIIEFNIPTFNVIYSKIESTLYAGDIEYENITPLCGFTMEDSNISLAENMSIVKLSEEEILDCFRAGVKLGPSQGDCDFIHGIHSYALKISYKFPKVIGERDVSLKDIEENEYFSYKNERAIIDALRIYKEGKLYPISSIRKSRSLLSLGYYISAEIPVKPFMNDKYKLLKSETSEFKSFFEKKTKAALSEKNFLSVGIRRFSQSNERDNIEDRIIDLMIAAEAIFLSPDGDRGELSYRLSHRAAMFIETDVNKQRYLFDFMRNAYDIRSKIVHGTKPKLPQKMDGSNYTLDEFCDDIEKKLRISIKKAITLTAAAKAKGKSNKIDWKSIIFPSV